MEGARFMFQLGQGSFCISHDGSVEPRISDVSLVSHLFRACSMDKYPYGYQIRMVDTLPVLSLSLKKYLLVRGC